MKSYIYPLAISLVISAASCSREEENIWEDSAAVRTEKVVKEQFETLCGAPNGWSMYYFAAESENGGVNFTLNFNENGSVAIGTKNIYNSPVFAEETSLWEIITDNGPVLTFNSYNNLFHFFSDPDDGIAGGSKGVGLGGDYEFMIMSYCPDSIVLKGKKTGVYCKMFPLEADITPEEYFVKIDEFQNTMVNSLLAYIWFESENGERYTAKFNTDSRTVVFVIEGGDPLFDKHTIPYVITNTGIRLFEPFEGDNETFSVQNFVYNAEATTLTCTDDGKSKFYSEDLGTLFANNEMRWAFYENDAHGAFSTIYQDVVDGCKATFKQTFNHFSFRYNSTGKSQALWFRNGNSYTNCNLYCSYEINGNEITFSFSGDGDSNGKGHLNRIDAFKDLVNLLTTGTYILECDSKLNASHMRLISKLNPENYLDLYAE